MYSYEVLTHLLGYETGRAKKMSWDNILIPFVVGGASRSLASTTLLPINVVRMRLQMKTYTRDEMEAKKLRMQETNKGSEIRYNGMIDTIKKIYRNEGMKGFYKGLTPNILKIFPTSGLFFLSYELTLSYLD